MKTIRVDFSKCENSEQMHEQLRRALNLPEYYGGNLDALWDVLTGLPYKGKHFIITLPDAESDIASYADSICDIFREAGVSFETVK